VEGEPGSVRSRDPCIHHNPWPRKGSAPENLTLDPHGTVSTKVRSDHGHSTVLGVKHRHRITDGDHGQGRQKLPGPVASRADVGDQHPLVAEHLREVFRPVGDPVPTPRIHRHRPHSLKRPHVLGLAVQQEDRVDSEGTFSARRRYVQFDLALDGPRRSRHPDEEAAEYEGTQGKHRPTSTLQRPNSHPTRPRACDHGSSRSLEECVQLARDIRFEPTVLPVRWCPMISHHSRAQPDPTSRGGTHAPRERLSRGPRAYRDLALDPAPRSVPPPVCVMSSASPSILPRFRRESSALPRGSGPARASSTPATPGSQVPGTSPDRKTRANPLFHRPVRTYHTDTSSSPDRRGPRIRPDRGVAHPAPCPDNPSTMGARHVLRRRRPPAERHPRHRYGQ
jgi:hypothetical protein